MTSALHPPTAAPPRCLAVWLAVSATTALVARVVASDLERAWTVLTQGDPAGEPFDRLLVWLCSAALVACGAWLWAATTAVTLGAVRGRVGVATPGVPAWLRRLLLVACGVALTGAVVAPATATAGALHLDHADQRGRTGAVAVRGLPLPDRPLGSAASIESVARASPARVETTTTVVVRPGDTLWALAREALPPGAPDRAVAELSDRLHTINREVVGADPDLILPGQRLLLPPPDPS